MRSLLIVALLVASIAASGCASGKETAAAAPKTVSAVRLLDDGMGAFEGYVVDERLLAIAGATVKVRQADRVVRTDREGYFYTGPLPAGRYTVDAQRDGHHAVSQKVTVVAGEVGLRVFSLTSIPVPSEYAVKQVHHGFLFCAAALGRNGAREDVSVMSFDFQCELPRRGGSENTHRTLPIIEVEDRSVRRWVLDEPGAIWTSNALTTRWNAAHELARALTVDFAVDGCTDPHRSFGAVSGYSPLQHDATPRRVEEVLNRTEGATCATPGERCDEHFCVLTSRVRAAGHVVAGASARAGVVVQQAFDQELSAAFKRV